MDIHSILLFLAVSIAGGVVIAVVDTALRNRQNDREDARRRNRR